MGQLTQFVWIEHCNFPGGSSSFNYYLENSTLWINVLGTDIVRNGSSDALLPVVALWCFSLLLYLFANFFLFVLQAISFIHCL